MNNNSRSLLINKSSRPRNSSVSLTAATQCNSVPLHLMFSARHATVSYSAFVGLCGQSCHTSVIIFCSDVRLEILVSGYYIFHVTINLAIYIQITDDRSVEHL
jgi:hypothetical protein